MLKEYNDLVGHSVGSRKGNKSDKLYCSNGRNISIIDSREGSVCIGDLAEKDFFVFRGDLYLLLRDRFYLNANNCFALSFPNLDIVEFVPNCMVDLVCVKIEIMKCEMDD